MKNKRKVAIIFEDGRLGGQLVYIKNIIDDLSEEFDISVFLPANSSHDAVLLFGEAQCNVVFWRCSRVERSLTGLLGYVSFLVADVFRLRHELARREFHLVYAAGGAWQIKSVLCRCLLKVPVIWHLNDTYMPLIVRICFSVLSRRSDYFIFASRASKIFYEKIALASCDGVVIGASVGASFFKRSLRTKKLGFRVVSVGNVNAFKGFELLLDVAAEVARVEPRIEFVVVGKVFESQIQYYEALLVRLRERGLNNVHFITSGGDVIEHLDCSSVYLCSSRFESSPIAVREAMARGIPVIAGDVGDISVIASNCDGVDLMQRREAELFASSILRLYSDPEAWVRMSKACRAYAVGNFRAKHAAKLHMQVFNEVIDHAG